MAMLWGAGLRSRVLLWVYSPRGPRGGKPTLRLARPRCQEADAAIGRRGWEGDVGLTARSRPLRSSEADASTYDPG
jgi:hypothetical protein